MNTTQSSANMFESNPSFSKFYKEDEVVIGKVRPDQVSVDQFSCIYDHVPVSYKFKDIDAIKREIRISYPLAAVHYFHVRKSLFESSYAVKLQSATDASTNKQLQSHYSSCNAALAVIQKEISVHYSLTHFNVLFWEYERQYRSDKRCKFTFNKGLFKSFCKSMGLKVDKIRRFSGLSVFIEGYYRWHYFDMKKEMFADRKFFKAMDTFYPFHLDRDFYQLVMDDDRYADELKEYKPSKQELVRMAVAEKAAKTDSWDTKDKLSASSTDAHNNKQVKKETGKYTAAVDDFADVLAGASITYTML